LFAIGSAIPIMLELVVVGVVLEANGNETLFGFSIDRPNSSISDTGVIHIVETRRNPDQYSWLETFNHLLACENLKNMLKDGLATGCAVSFDVAFVNNASDFFDHLPGRPLYDSYPSTLRSYRFLRFRDRLEGLRVSKRTPFYLKRVEPLALPLQELLPKEWPTHTLVECAMSALRRPSSRVPPWKMCAVLPHDILEQILAAPPHLNQNANAY
jgi:hypothetical protein